MQVLVRNVPLDGHPEVADTTAVRVTWGTASTGRVGPILRMTSKISASGTMGIGMLDSR